MVYKPETIITNLDFRKRKMFQNYMWQLFTFFWLTVGHPQRPAPGYVCIRENCYQTTDRINYTILENIRYLEIMKKPTNLSQWAFVKLRNLKQLNMHDRTFYRVCSQYDTFEQTKWDQMTMSPYVRVRTVSLYKNGFEECLKSYCQGNSYGSLDCSDDHITDLSTNYVNRTCFSSIQAMDIESRQLTTIGHQSIFSDNQTVWNLIYLNLILLENCDPIKIDCDAFRFLKKLRSLYVNVLKVPNFECIFQHNPDLVNIRYDEVKVWNLCNGSIEIRSGNDIYDVTNFTKLFFDREKDDLELFQPNKDKAQKRSIIGTGEIEYTKPYSSTYKIGEPVTEVTEEQSINRNAVDETQTQNWIENKQEEPTTPKSEPQESIVTMITFLSPYFIFVLFFSLYCVASHISNDEE